MPRQLKEEDLGVSYFKSGVAEPAGGLTVEEALEILRTHELVEGCKVLAGKFISVELKEPIGLGELRTKFQPKLRSMGVEFHENHKHYLMSYKPGDPI